MTPMGRDDDWGALGLDPEEAARLRRHRPTEGMSPHRAEELRARILSRLDAPGPRVDPWAALRAAWFHLRLRPLSLLGGSAALLALGVVVMGLGAHGIALPKSIPLALWAVMAPWLAFLAVLGPSRWGSDALGQMVLASPLQAWRIRLWEAFGLGILDGAFVSVVGALWAGAIGASLTAMMLHWWVPFLLSAGVALWLAGGRTRRRSAVVSILLCGLNTVLVGWLVWHGELAVYLAPGVPTAIGLLLGLGLTVSGAWARWRGVLGP